MTSPNSKPIRVSEEQHRNDNKRKFRLVAITDASELVDYLRPSNPVWKSSINPDTRDAEWNRWWYFRGQADADWELMPSAWRKSKPEKKQSVIELGHDSYTYVQTHTENTVNYLKANGTPPQCINWDAIAYIAKQIAIELQIVREFIEFADSVGHIVPNSNIPLVNSGFIQGVVSDLVNGTQVTLHPEIWFDKAMLLAQHHGIPTRLLDWTRHPLTAAYFAVSDAIANPPESGYFAIYALHKYHLNRRNVYEVLGRSSENRYLAAQQGVLTVDQNAERFYLTHLHYPDVMSSLFNFGEYPDPQFCPCKFIVPFELAHELIRQLFLERVTRAHLMPTLDNVAQTIKDKWHFVLTPPPEKDMKLTIDQEIKT